MVKETGKQPKRVMRYQKPGGGEAALVYDAQTGKNVTVSGAVQDALEARAFQDAVASGALAVPEQEVEVQQSRPRRGRKGATDELPDSKPDGDSMLPEELVREWEQLFAAGALKLIDEE